MIQCFCIRLASSRGSSSSSWKRAVQDDQLVEAAFAIAEDQVVAAAVDRLRRWRSSTVAEAVHWPMSPPWAPALPCRAPPRVPGMPTRVSSPARPRWTAVVTTRPRLGAAAGDDPPAVDLDLAELRGPRAARPARARPRRGPGCSSRGPAARTSTPSSWLRSTRAINWSGLSGSAKYSAGPPNWNQVCIASGSACRTIFSKPVQETIPILPMSPAPMVNNTSPGADGFPAAG